MKRFAMAALLGLAALAAQGQVVQGLTFSVTTDGDYPHGSIQIGRAITGFYDIAQYERGLSEFDLNGIGLAQSAVLSFRYASQSSTQPAAYPLSGTATLFAYTGNNAAEVTDYGAPRNGTVGSFAIEGFQIGDTITFDVTSLLNQAIARHDAAFGVGLLVNGPYFRQTGVSSFVGYDNFTLEVTHAVAAAPIPEPSTWVLALGGLCAVGARVRRSHRPDQRSV